MKKMLAIETKRISLRKLQLTDVKQLVLIGNEKDISDYTRYMPFPFKENDAKKIIQETTFFGGADKELFRWGIVVDEVLIGIIDLYSIDKKNKKAHIGYWIGKEHRRKGYASQAIDAIIDYGFIDMKLHKIAAKTMADNVASNELLAKKGFKKAGILQKEKLVNGQWVDCYLWEKLEI